MPTDRRTRPARPPKIVRGWRPSTSNPTTFVPVYATLDGEQIREPEEGHIELGSEATVYEVRPRVTQKLDLGSSSRQWRNGNFAGDLAGQRLLFPFGHNASFAAAVYAYMVDGVQSQTTRGYPMMRPGSLIGISAMFRVVSHTTDGTLTVSGSIDGVSRMTTAKAITAGDVGNYLETHAIQSRSAAEADGDVFTAGEFFSISTTFGGGLVATLDRLVGLIEVVFDT